MKSGMSLAGILVCLIILSGCTRKFAVVPQMKSFDFEVVDNYGDVNYEPIVDARSELEREGKVGGGCSGGRSGVMNLGDENYKNPLLPEFDNHLIAAIQNSRLFSNIDTQTNPTQDVYVFSSSLDRYLVTLDEAKAQQTQACIGGIIGAAIASSIDVTATTDIQLTGNLTRNNEEIWRHTITKQVVEHNDYGKTEKNTENCMGNAIGEACNELITELAIFLSSN